MLFRSLENRIGWLKHTAPNRYKHAVIQCLEAATSLIPINLHFSGRSTSGSYVKVVSPLLYIAAIMAANLWASQRAARTVSRVISGGQFHLTGRPTVPRPTLT